MADPELIIYAPGGSQQAMEGATDAILEAESFWGEYHDTREPRLWRGFTPELESYFIAHLERLIDSAKSWEWQTGESSPAQTVGPQVKFTRRQPKIVGWYTVGDPKLRRG